MHQPDESTQAVKSDISKRTLKNRSRRQRSNLKRKNLKKEGKLSRPMPMHRLYKVSPKYGSNYIFFHSNKFKWSNFYECQFRVTCGHDDFVYDSSERMYQEKKHEYLNQEFWINGPLTNGVYHPYWEEIRSCFDAHETKKISNLFSKRGGYKLDKRGQSWHTVKNYWMRVALLHKFISSNDLYYALRWNTVNFAEASKTDTYYGTGFDLDHIEPDSTKWIGQNVLGCLLKDLQLFLNGVIHWNEGVALFIQVWTEIRQTHVCVEADCPCSRVHYHGRCKEV